MKINVGNKVIKKLNLVYDLIFGIFNVTQEFPKEIINNLFYNETIFWCCSHRGVSHVWGSSKNGGRKKKYL